MCTEMVGHCLSVGGDHAELDHISLLLDCAQICMTSAAFMMRVSDLHRELCQVCALTCERCVASCARLAGDDPVMLQCAEICRLCAVSCQQMAA